MCRLTVFVLTAVVLLTQLEFTYASTRMILKKHKTDGIAYLKSFTSNGYKLARRHPTQDWRRYVHERAPKGLIVRHHGQTDGSAAREHRDTRRAKPLDRRMDSRYNRERGVDHSMIIGLEQSAVSTTSSAVSGTPSVQSSSHSDAPTTTSSSLFPSSSAESPLPIENMDGVAWTIDVQIGPQKTKIPVMVDTGSQIFWVVSQQCDLCVTGGMTPSVDMGNTCANPEQSIAYGTGSCAGCYTQTTLEIGDYTLTDYKILGVTMVDSVMASEGWLQSGIWGLATASTSDPTPVDVLFQQGKISSPVVGFFLARDEDPSDSEVVIGDPANLATSDMPVNWTTKVVLPRDKSTDPHYNVKMDGINVYGSPVVGTSNLNVILDTGTTMFNVPTADIALQIFIALGKRTTFQDPVTKQYYLPCHLTTETDDSIFNIQFGGHNFGVQYRDLIGPEAPSHAGMCQPMIMSVIEDMWILGGTFLVNVFHSVNPQTGEVTMWDLDA